MKETEYITIISKWRKVKIQKDHILYVRSMKKYIELHMYDKTVYKTIMPIWKMENELGDDYIEVKRGCIVARWAIKRIANKIDLVNGEVIDYTVRNKKEIVAKLQKNPKIQIKIPVRGVYQIMNPGVFDRNVFFTYVYGKKENSIAINTILYVIIHKNNAEIHTLDKETYRLRMTLKQIKEQLGDEFVPASRSLLVSARAVHEVSDKIYLSNGEKLGYVLGRKRELRNKIQGIQKTIIGRFAEDGVPKTYKEYCSYYRSFEQIPFAFADIEMVFNEELHAVDWIFCYGNEELAKLEKLPLEKMIGSSFGSLFPNMDSKWLRSYEQTALYGEKIEIIDYSPEIDTYLKVICFPTFPGHCGCILFNIDDIKLEKSEHEQMVKV